MDGKDNMRSWATLTVVTFTVLLEIGVIKGFSVLLPDIKRQLGTHTWIVGSCVSIITGWGCILGLSAAAVSKRFGLRFCLTISGLFSSIGLIICACATSVHMLLLGLVFTGFLLFQENVAIGIIPEYFNKYFDAAVNIYMFGTAIALMILPVLAQLLLDVYGWRGTLILLSGLCLQSIPWGALIKQQQMPQTDEIERTPLFSFTKGLPAEDSNKDTSSFKLLQTFYEIVGASLLTSFPFIARVLVPGFVCGYVFSGWAIYTVSFAQSNGASVKESSVVATCGGIGVAAIRIVLPFLNKLMTYKQLLYISSCIMAVSLALVNVWNSFLGMNVTSVIFGIGIGIHCVEANIAAKDIAEAKFMYAIAWYHFMFGLAAILSGTLTGLIFDVTDSFTLSFTILSAVSAMTAVFLGLEDIWSGIKAGNAVKL